MLDCLRALAARPLLVGQVVVGVVALVALALFVARSGNDPGVGVSATELKMRSLLDKYLSGPPAHQRVSAGPSGPAARAGGGGLGPVPAWVLPLLVIGAIGQSSLMDTFCHLHTPLLISGLRGLIGWVLGAVFGALVWVVAVARAVAARKAAL